IMKLREPPMYDLCESLCGNSLAPLRLIPYTLAKELRTSRARMERLVREEVPVTVDTALRLGRYFRTTPDFWLNLQSAYDLTVAEATGTWLHEIPIREDAA